MSKGYVGALFGVDWVAVVSAIALLEKKEDAIVNSLNALEKSTEDNYY